MNYIKTEYEGCPYITANKLYPVIKKYKDTCTFIADNNELTIVCINTVSHHLGLDGIFELIDINDTI